MVEKLKMSIFQNNLNQRNIPSLALDMYQTVYKGLI